MPHLTALADQDVRPSHFSVVIVRLMRQQYGQGPSSWGKLKFQGLLDDDTNDQASVHSDIAMAASSLPERLSPVITRHVLRASTWAELRIRMEYFASVEHKLSNGRERKGGARDSKTKRRHAWSEKRRPSEPSNQIMNGPHKRAAPPHQIRDERWQVRKHMSNGQTGKKSSRAEQGSRTS